jgi:hypothetical protein
MHEKTTNGYEGISTTTTTIKRNQTITLIAKVVVLPAPKMIL